MALKSTIFRAELNISDVNHHHYGDHKLTIARHPSETDERMMIRVLAFAHIIGQAAGEGVEFGKGLSTDDEPDIWQKNLRGDIVHWVELGRPSEERIRKACGKAQQVSVFSFGDHAVELWWKEIAGKLQRHSNLNVYAINKSTSTALAELTCKNMALYCSIDGNTMTIGNDVRLIDVDVETLFDPSQK
ncbi:hypothetical protein TDB9533_02862 [Thalassocella blandensis]|nr:hypothetical protein TDB9533_02862 [Thalassocella blandensis]